jgi:uncharacterized membrane protein
MLQGVLSAVLVLKNPGTFYVAIVVGLLFYLVAGYFTTRKGGSSLRGIWAGFWSGIISTAVFWVVLLIGLLVQVVQLAQRLHLNINDQQTLRDTYGNALHQAVPLFSGHAAGPQGSSVVSYLVVSLLFAMGFGLLGGVLGVARLRSRMRGKGYA